MATDPKLEAQENEDGKEKAAVVERDDSDDAIADFLSSMHDYLPVIPDELAEYYLNRSGFQCPDLRVTRLVSVATQKFISEIINDAFQLCKLRQNAPLKKEKQSKEKRFVLTTEDLALALKEYGVNLKRQEYYSDSPVEGTGIGTERKAEDAL